jgi:hypothetical protein
MNTVNVYHQSKLVKTLEFLTERQAVNYLIEKAAHTINGFPLAFDTQMASSHAPGLLPEGFSGESQNSKIVAHYVNHRWLGGLLTNWSTMKICIDQLNDLEKREENGELQTLPKKLAARLEEYTNREAF